jgi:hypothetical protein
MGPWAARGGAVCRAASPTAARALLQGDPKSVDDLHRAGAERASKALLLGGPRLHATEDGTLQEGALADAEVIFAFQHLKMLNRNLEVYCQVRQELPWRGRRCPLGTCLAPVRG